MSTALEPNDGVLAEARRRVEYLRRENHRLHEQIRKWADTVAARDREIRRLEEEIWKLNELIAVTNERELREKLKKG